MFPQNKKFRKIRPSASKNFPHPPTAGVRSRRCSSAFAISSAFRSKYKAGFAENSHPETLKDSSNLESDDPWESRNQQEVHPMHSTAEAHYNRPEECRFLDAPQQKHGNPQPDRPSGSGPRSWPQKGFS